MTRSTYIIIGILVVLFVAGGSWVLLHRTTVTDVSNESTNATTINANASAKDKNLMGLIATRLSGTLEERIEFVGGSLINVPTDALSKNVGDTTKLPVHTTYIDGMTTSDAVPIVASLLKSHPAKIMVFDIGRYDLAKNISVQETTTNLSTLTSQLSTLGIKAVIIGGVSADGDTQFASSIRNVVEPQAVFIDASALLQNPQQRISFIELNGAGAATLAAMVDRIVESQ